MPCGATQLECPNLATPKTGLELILDRQASQGLLDDASESDDSLKDPSPYPEGVAEAPCLQRWDPSRFTLQRVLPLAKQATRPIELYTDGLSGQTVVAKRLPPEESERGLRALSGAGSRGLEEAWPEVLLTQRLGRGQGGRPEGVCACHGAFLDERGDVLLVTEYIPCGDLFDFTCSLSLPGPEREQQAWPVILSLLRAVQRLHERGVAHCDISLENTLRRPEGDVVLIDFEMAVAGGRCLETGIRGKPPYMSPEMWSQPWDTFAADFFACGVAAYALAVGSYPWESTKPQACRKFAYFAKHGFPAFLQRRRTVSGNAGSRSIAECLSPRLCKLLKVLLSWSPSTRELALAYLA